MTLRGDGANQACHCHMRTALADMLRTAYCVRQTDYSRLDFVGTGGEIPLRL
jgi:hypothetical protein